MADIIPDPWHARRRFTASRIALGHTGVGQRTGSQLGFQPAHARARDAVHHALDTAKLTRALAAPWPGSPPPLLLHSAALDRNVYLQRPDLGRRLDAPSCALLTVGHGASGKPPYDLAIVVADGLSAIGVEKNAAPLVEALHARLAGETWTLAPIAIVEQAGVAVGAEVGEPLGAKMVVVLIGERPGLSSPDSMGLYIAWAPAIGLSDERRNCISNVRPGGMGVDEAAGKLHCLLAEARRRQLSRVRLKDETNGANELKNGSGPAFLLQLRAPAVAIKRRPSILPWY